MLKKFLAAIGLVGMLTTSTAMAFKAIPEPANPPANGAYLTNFVVGPASFDASKGQTVNVGFNLAAKADIYAYVVKTADSSIVATLANYAPLPASEDNSYSWLGKVGNVAAGAALADGKYTVKVFVSVQGAIKDYKYQDVNIVTGPVFSDKAPKTSNLKVDPTPFSPATGEDTDIYFDVDKNGFITVELWNEAGTEQVGKTFDDYNYDYYDAGKHSVNWNGKDDDGDVVNDGNYVVVVITENDDGIDIDGFLFEVETTNPLSKGVIKNFSLDPSGKWDPTDGELEINFELTSEVKSLHIQAKQGNNVIKIMDDKVVDDDDYTETWDGTDDDGDFISEGEWTITLIADGDKVSDSVNVKYDQPGIVEAFVTKDSFDPSENESVTLVFKVDTKSEVTVEAFQGSQKELKLLNNEPVKKNKWYAVSWDGMDKDGEEVDFGKDWKFRITAENETEDDILDTKNIEFDIEEDEVSDKKSNVTNDFVSPVVFDNDQSDTVTLSYTIDEDAAVFVAVYEGVSTGGKAEIELLDFVEQASGSHTVEWNGKNDKNKTLSDGVYTYKLISKANGNYKETEIGRFVVGNSGDFVSPEPTPEPGPTPEPAPIACGDYTDTKFIANSDYELCAAIDWVTTQGVFGGYSDGTFSPYNTINRAEVLKVVFEAFKDVTILPNDGSTQGFFDLDPSAWYMPYVRTAKFYGMLQGYSDGSAGVTKNISRAEFLKFTLKASEAFTGYTVPKYAFSYYVDVNVNDPGQSWFKDFAGVAYEMNLFNIYDKNYVYGSPVYLQPSKLVTRGEVALVLYRMYNAGLLGYTPWEDGMYY
ncbi:MAG: FlgD immunoglobulin-like domain containing protein [Patescibacteria group bacterium]